VPATAFAGKLGDLLGISNGGTPVSLSSVLPGETKLDAAMRELKLGGMMQSLGTLNGVAFYATRNANGHFCFALVRVDGQFGKGFGCGLNADNFSSARVQALTFRELTRLQGVAADGVATVQAGRERQRARLDAGREQLVRLDDGRAARSRRGDPHARRGRECHRDRAAAQGGAADEQAGQGGAAGEQVTPSKVCNLVQTVV
jgi:hypothetical protein